MSLNWNLSAIEDREKVCNVVLTSGETQMSAITQTLIWHTMSIGMSEITPDNYHEFFVRVFLTERVFGALRTTMEMKSDKVISTFVNKQDVERHVGLYTNADEWTRTKFLSKLYGSALEKSKNNALK